MAKAAIVEVLVVVFTMLAPGVSVFERHQDTTT
jgi:hypothetical protein